MNKEIPSLTGIRGLAALIVFIAHAGLERIVPGGLGVTIFFFLSGFLITTLLRREYTKTGEINFKGFYWRRAKRILPPMYLVLVLSVIWGLETGSDFQWLPTLAQFFHLTNYALIHASPNALAPYTGPMWSLAIEEHFYLLYPLVLLAVLKWPGHRIATVFTSFCAASLLWRLWLITHGASSDYIYHATDTRFDSLLYGCILAVGFSPLTRLSVAPKKAAVALCAGLGLLCASLVIRNPLFRDTARYSLQGVALLPVFYCAVRFHHWKAFAFLHSRALRAMGLISYTFYLSHLAFLQIALAHFHSRLLAAIAGFAAAALFSALSYWLMERPLTQRVSQVAPAGQAIATVGDAKIAA